MNEMTADYAVGSKALGRYLSDPDHFRAGRAMQAMMKMRKLFIADLDKAFAG